MKTHANNTRSGPRGFTIVELLIAIGVLALIATGLAIIFGSIGDAVASGRRASELNRAATRIETRIRDDLSSLTRDGFMVITQRYASDENGVVLGLPGSADPDGVRLSARDAVGRPRRVDELMFFARGDFQTARPPLVSGMTADAGEAAIYYGIGQKRPPDLLNPDASNRRNFFFNPSPRDNNLLSGGQGQYAALLGVPEPNGRPANPNRYARDWSLLRQVTLLTEPRGSRVLPPDVYHINRRSQINNGLVLLEDSQRQVALQPAARSIFNSLSWSFAGVTGGAPGTPWPVDGVSRWWIGDDAAFPGGQSPADRSVPAWRSSGVVDIAQGSVLTIRRQLESLAGADPALWPSNYYAPSQIPPGNPRPPAFNQSADGFGQDWLDPARAPSPGDAAGLDLTTGATDSARVRAWALDMLPSLWDGEAAPPLFLAGVRYEDVPTRLVYDNADFQDSPRGRLAQAISAANQEMLVSQVFVPRCSEFIVEWSYGFVDNSLGAGHPDFKKMQWYGIPRATRDDDGDGDIDMDDHAAAPSVRRYRPRTSGAPSTNAPIEPEFEQVMANDVSASNVTSPDFAVFGVIDPAGDPDPSDDFVVLWPRFIRITMSLADPADETTERTFQFVFAVPGEQG